MPIAYQDGRRLHCSDSGGDSGVHAPALVFIHAYTTHGGLWDGMIARFAPSYRCLALDLPGHGRSDGTPDASDMAYLARSVLAVMDDAGVERAHVCGLSIGGMIGQQLGLDHGKRLRSLVLACTTGQMSEQGRGLWDGRFEAMQRQGLWSQIAPTLERWYGAGLMGAFGPADLDPLAQMIASTSLVGALSCGLAVKSHDVLSRLDAIATPTLILGGQLDLSFPPEHAQALAGAIGGARLVMLDGAGHMAPLQVPDAFAHALSAFLQEHER
jgi:3-oxoadipate enol-lactonase